MDKITEDLCKMHNLTNTDEIYTFYYDETNNIRKLILKEDGLNIPQENNFVLAGIVHKGERHSANIEELFDRIRPHTNITEMKCKYIKEKNFPETLNSEKLSIILKWILNHNFFIHFCNLNILYWSIVDIIDSITYKAEETSKSHYIASIWEIKQDFYNLVCLDKKNFLKTLFEFQYPNIKGDAVHAFTCWLHAFFTSHKSNLDLSPYSYLEHLLKESTQMEQLPFIMEENDNILIENFMAFYQHSTFIFKNSIHIFDNEYQIQELIAKHSKLVLPDECGNHIFVDSKQHLEIQLSDIITGFLGQYFTFIKDNSVDDLLSQKSQFSSRQKENLSLLADIIKHTDKHQSGFLFAIIPTMDHQKHLSFLYS